MEPQEFYKQYKDSYVPKKGDTMKCSICGRKTHLLNNGKGPLICCGKPMLKAMLPFNEDTDMIYDKIREQLINESITGVMGCRAAKAAISTWQRRLSMASDERQKLIARKIITKNKMKVYKCKQRGLMI